MIESSTIAKDLKAVASLISVKGNVLTSSSNELNNDISYEIKRFDIPKSIHNYYYRVSFYDRVVYEEVDVEIPELNLKEKSLILKNGCEIVNGNGDKSFYFDSNEHSNIIMKLYLNDEGNCVLEID